MAKKEYIELESAKKVLEEHYAFNSAELLDEVPKADVQEVRHGEWKKVYKNDIATVYECTNCKHLTFGTSDYCICGTKMDKE